MTTKIPLYFSIMEVLKEAIINGKYGVGSLLPTEVELENTFKVSKITIRKAIELLENDGYVIKQSGKGTTVVSNSIFNKISKGESFTTILNKQGCQINKEKTTFEVVSLLPQNELYQHFGSKCIKITRLYYLDGIPYIHMTHYLPGDVKVETITNHNDFSIYMYLYKNKYFVDRFNDEFYIDHPTLDVLGSLDLKDGPLLGRKRTTFNMEHQVIEISYARYNTRMHHYQIEHQI